MFLFELLQKKTPKPQQAVWAEGPHEAFHRESIAWICSSEA